MAKLAREELFSPDEIACVHVMNRAVRRCFLMGDDPLSGKNFDHRKVWLEKKIELQAANFGIDVLGIAILSNHFHLVLRSRPDVVKTWDDAEVARRWFMLCPQRKNEDGSAKEPTSAEIHSIANDPDRLQQIRRRLSDISWWMRLLCQHIGQRANRETGESGHFWESRFRSVRLLDESALLACVAYVDLNPIRAKLAETIENSDFTSAQKRLEALLLKSKPSVDSSPRIESSSSELPDRSLAPVQCDERNDALGPSPSRSDFRCSDKGFLNMTAAEYLGFLDWTARSITSGKPGSTPQNAPPILERVGLPTSAWLGLVKNFGKLFHNVAGKPHEIARARSRRRKARFRVRSRLQAVFVGG
jgi:REP element-mobilizing transposase RayT